MYIYITTKRRHRRPSFGPCNGGFLRTRALSGPEAGQTFVRLKAHKISPSRMTRRRQQPPAVARPMSSRAGALDAARTQSGSARAWSSGPLCLHSRSVCRGGVKRHESINHNPEAPLCSAEAGAGDRLASTLVVCPTFNCVLARPRVGLVVPFIRRKSALREEWKLDQPTSSRAQYITLAVV